MIYLDSAATSLQKPVCVENAVTNAMRSMASPGRGGHSAAMAAAKTVFDCRVAAAELFNVAEPERVVFTCNATHALNIAIATLVHEGTRVLVSGFEHNSVTRPLHAARAEIHVAGRTLFSPENTMEEFERAIADADVVVCTMASNVFGYILPIYDIAQLCSRRGIPLIVDASQAAGILDVDFARLGAAFVAMPGHKGLFGPQGTGILLCGQEGTPILHGGSGSDSISQAMPDYLPDRLEAGTHNVTGIAGLLAGIRYIEDKGRENILSHEQRLLGKMVDELSDTDGLTLYAGQPQIGVLSFRSSKVDSESLAQLLSEREICARAGLHCAPLAHESAGTLPMGTVRFSVSPFTDMRQIEQACQAVKEIIY